MYCNVTGWDSDNNRSKSYINGGSISNNKAGYGGGIYVAGGQLTIWSCSIDKNEASYSGGGIYAEYTSETSAENKTELFLGNPTGNEYPTISNNYAGYYGGGGVYAKNINKFFMWNKTTISNNTSMDMGGGICFKHVKYYLISTYNMSSVNRPTIEGNRAAFGAGIYLYDSCSLKQNFGSTYRSALININIMNNTLINVNNSTGKYEDSTDQTARGAAIYAYNSVVGLAGLTSINGSIKLLSSYIYCEAYDQDDFGNHTIYWAGNFDIVKFIDDYSSYVKNNEMPVDKIYGSSYSIGGNAFFKKYKTTITLDITSPPTAETNVASKVKNIVLNTPFTSNTYPYLMFVNSSQYSNIRITLGVADEYDTTLGYAYRGFFKLSSNSSGTLKCSEEANSKYHLIYES